MVKDNFAFELGLRFDIHFMGSPFSILKVRFKVFILSFFMSFSFRALGQVFLFLFHI